MPQTFFKKDILAQKDEPLSSTEIKHIFAKIPKNAYLFIDLDDTVGRLPQQLGLDAWFRFRIAEFSEKGATEIQAIELAVQRYTDVQLASHKMVAVDTEIDIKEEFEVLKKRGIKIIGLTARNYELTDITLEQLSNLGVSFSDAPILNQSFKLGKKKISVKGGIVFANGYHKGEVLKAILEKRLIPLEEHKHIVFIDDSKKNCLHVLGTLQALGRPHSVWHYQYAEKHRPFTESHKALSRIQEAFFLAQKKILSDKKANERLSLNLALRHQSQP